MTHPNQPPFTEHERVRGALTACCDDALFRGQLAEKRVFQDLRRGITPEGARKLVALLRL